MTEDERPEGETPKRRGSGKFFVIALVVGTAFLVLPEYIPAVVGWFAGLFG